jgi:excinuclease UvrABC nuclease subunit
VASKALVNGDHKAALQAIDDGVEAIRRFLRDYHQEDRESQCSELRSLLNWRHEVELGQPIGPLERLKRELDEAVELEAYENAARIRDQIRRLSEGESREQSPR